ncbi:MAG: thioredoxin family protein [Bacillota bacterium]
MKDKYIIKNEKQFKELLENNEYLLVLFSSNDCGYCQMAENNIKQILPSIPQLELYKIKLNTEVGNIFKKYDVNSVPIIKLFKNSAPVYTGFGVRMPNDLYYQLKSFL